jgi:hypothetical protein
MTDLASKPSKQPCYGLKELHDWTSSALHCENERREVDMMLVVESVWFLIDE